VHAHLDHVVPRLGLDLGGVLGLLRTHVRDVIDLELDAGVLGEALADLRELLVGGRGEVVPAEIGDLPLLPTRGRYPGGEDPREPGPSGGQKLSAIHWMHEVPPSHR